tara:strand:+ start:97 stop:438 length:342 start_codon:yes stop_codon:yes gene_type:complete
MILIISFSVSVLLNVLVIWYVIKLLKKFLFISENLSDLYLTTKAFQVFVKALYSMDNYNGEPMIQELILRIREVTSEMERFREIFEFTLDEEIEEELNAVEEEEEAARPLQVV